MNMPPIGTDLTTDEMIALVNSFVPTDDSAEGGVPYAVRCEQNAVFVRRVESLVRIGGVWGWIRTETIWERSPKGFKRKA